MINDDNTITSLSDTVERDSTRLDNIQKEIEDARGEDYETLVARFDAIDEDIQSITNQLGTTTSDLNEVKSDLNTESTGIKDRLSAVEDIASKAAVASTVNASLNNLNESLTSLDERLDAIDGGEKLEGNALNSRVSTLETTVGDSTAGLVKKVNDLETAPKSATKVIDAVTYDTEGNPILVSEEPSEDVDYLLKNGDKYYYWKYINETWQLISGGSGGEAELPDEIINEIGV